MYLCVLCVFAIQHPGIDKDFVVFLGSSLADELARAEIKKAGNKCTEKELWSTKQLLWNAMSKSQKKSTLVKHERTTRMYGIRMHHLIVLDNLNLLQTAVRKKPNTSSKQTCKEVIAHPQLISCSVLLESVVLSIHAVGCIICEFHGQCENDQSCTIVPPQQAQEKRPNKF
jgi:hypothetical protein